MRRDYLIKSHRPLHRLAHERGVVNAATVVRVAANEGCHSLDVRKLPAVLALGYRAEGNRPYDRVAPDNVKLKPEIFKTVGCGRKVWHGAHRGVAAVSRRHASRLYCLLVRKARFTKMHMHISETGQNMIVRAVYFSGNKRRNSHSSHIHALDKCSFLSAVSRSSRKNNLHKVLTFPHRISLIIIPHVKEKVNIYKLVYDMFLRLFSKSRPKTFLQGEFRFVR